ncbi:hypothetical protein M3Y95_00300700 [Aphelenchoides besseyi]|nr:hypothetical protein M3Y95_00300700 [Aphelenchoides besseyi]
MLSVTTTTANRAGMPKLKFCDYMNRIGAIDSHCLPSGMGASVKARKPSSIEQQQDDPATSIATSSSKPAPGYKQCFLKYNPTKCQRSDYCESNLLCVDIVGNCYCLLITIYLLLSGNPCCVAPKGTCPTKQQLGIRCVRTKPTNWCDSDYDCGGRNSLCCDTGCGYNICYIA